MIVSVFQILNFLKKVDNTFPVSLSSKQPLKNLAVKLHDKATIECILKNDKIVSCVFGYTRNVVNNIGYISIVATLPEEYGQGYAPALIKRFLAKAKEENLDAIHLYTDSSNIKAIEMYKKIGFVRWEIINEPRPDDEHLIFWIKNERN